MSIREQLSNERKQLQKDGHLPEWFTTQGWSLFKQKYAVPGEDAFLGRAKTIAKTAARHAPKDGRDWEGEFFKLIWNGWLSCSTPVLSNMGTNRGMPVSCSGQVIPDSITGFYTTLHNAAMLSKMGFGTSGYLGKIRPRGSKISTGGTAQGVLPVLQDFVTMSSKVSQGGTRRGSWAGYLPISHGDFQEAYDFIKDQPDEVNIGWNWYAKDIKAMNDRDAETDRRFKAMMKLRAIQGKGYMFKPDTANKHRPQMYVDHNLFVEASNLCCEITLFSDELHDFTCVLAAMNLAKRNEWKNTDAIFVATVFLDCVASEFIERARGIPGLENAIRFTEKGRALGLGVCGFHTYLQQERIPFESLDAQFFNHQYFKEHAAEALRASKYMAVTLGEPEWCKGYGVRNTHRTAFMPTMSTAAIMGGVSQGIEPMLGNCFVQTTAGGEDERINPEFLKLMKERGKYSRKLVKEISDNGSSVQNLDWLTDHEKLVFKTAFEINQEVIIRYASQRQRHNCQGQSLNLFVSADESEGYIAHLHRLILEDEYLNGAYYLRSQSGVSASSGCVACQ